MLLHDLSLAPVLDLSISKSELPIPSFAPSPPSLSPLGLPRSHKGTGSDTTHHKTFLGL